MRKVNNCKMKSNRLNSISINQKKQIKKKVINDNKN